MAPVIIKRKKVVGGGGHHGGAWKVAYADFVTAMMAFFLLMWLLNATTEKQRKGIADYFNPPIAVNRVSGGGDGNFGGETVFSENVLPRMGTGATSQLPSEQHEARGAINASDSTLTLAEVEAAQALLGSGGESILEINEQRHVELRITDEGLIVEFFDTADSPLFGDDNLPNPILESLMRAVSRTAAAVTSRIALKAHVRTPAVVRRDRPVWDVSAQRAEVARQLLVKSGLPANRIRRTSAMADRSPAHSNPMSPRNNRIEIVFLRK